MNSILSGINTSINYGDEVSKLYGTLGNEFCCGDVKIYRTDKPGAYDNIFDINDVWIKHIFKDEIIKYVNSNIWDDYPIKNSRIYDDLDIAFRFKDIRHISDSSKYIIEHLIRTVYLNRSILYKVVNYDWDSYESYMGRETLSLTGDFELNDEIYSLLKRDPKEDKFDFQVYVEVSQTASFGQYTQHRPRIIYNIKIKIPFNFNVTDSIKHQGFVVLDLFPRVKKLSDSM